MNGCNVTDILARGLQNYGEFVVTRNSVANLLKKHSKTESVRVTGIRMGHLRRAIAVCGNILEENDEAQFFIAVISTGVMKATRALVAVVLQKDELYFAAYAEEGLIKQHLAQRAIGLIKDQLGICPR